MFLLPGHGRKRRQVGPVSNSLAHRGVSRLTGQRWGLGRPLWKEGGLFLLWRQQRAAFSRNIMESG